MIAGAPSYPRQQLVCGQLHVLVGECVGGQLAGGVRVEPREGDHRPAADAPSDVLELGGIGTARLKRLRDETFLVARFIEVGAESIRQERPAGDLGRLLELGKRLYLDRMDVGQIFRQLVIDRAAAHRSLPSLAVVRGG